MLGQVYKCTLRSTGEAVAVKVQRPDIRKAVSLDLYLLRRYMHGLEWFKVNVLTGVFGAAHRKVMLVLVLVLLLLVLVLLLIVLLLLLALTLHKGFDVALLDAFATASYKEMDYVNEGKNQEVTMMLPLLLILLLLVLTLSLSSAGDEKSADVALDQSTQSALGAELAKGSEGSLKVDLLWIP